jgi:hypothetical protein
MSKLWKRVDGSDRLSLVVLGVCLVALVALVLLH